MPASTVVDLESGPIGDLVRAKRFDEALASLWREHERTPDDQRIVRRIQAVRDRMTSEALDRLRPLDRVVKRARSAPQDELDAPAERHVLDHCVDDAATLDVILDRSTLGRHRTARALESLLDLGFVRLVGAAVAPGPAAAPVDLAVAIVADGSPTQAALTRTLLRVALGGATRVVAAASGPEVVEAVRREKAGLVVTAFTLPGFDGLRAIRQCRASGRHVAGVVLVDRLDANFVAPKLPSGCVMLVRPIDKRGLHTAIAEAAGRPPDRGGGTA